MCGKVEPIPEFDPNALYFIPLGGSGEIGMNMNLYHFQGKWLIADLGAMFGDDATPLGVEVRHACHICQPHITHISLLLLNAGDDAGPAVH